MGGLGHVVPMRGYEGVGDIVCNGVGSPFLKRVLNPLCYRQSGGWQCVSVVG